MVLVREMYHVVIELYMSCQYGLRHQLKAMILLVGLRELLSSLHAMGWLLLDEVAVERG
ncbi:MAG: hypothetical protein QXW20_01875 [Ignisphaera sp.]